MFQRDYFMRMIGQMTEAIGQIMQLKRDMKQEEALLVIDELLDKNFGLSGNLIRSLSDKDLMGVMTTNGVIETDNIQAIAVLLKQEAELYAELGQEDNSYRHYLKSFHLFMRLTLVNAPPTIVNSAEEAKQLHERLKTFEFSKETKELLAEWHEGEGQFDLAENVLHELLEDGLIEQVTVEQFYKRIIFYDDERLIAGGLPREEVLLGIAEMNENKAG